MYDCGPAPTKLYLPIVSVVAALSNRNDSLDFDLPHGEPRIPVQGVSLAHCAEILRYIDDGVRNSADTEAHIGTRFGLVADVDVSLRSCCTVSILGWTVILLFVRRGLETTFTMRYEYFWRHTGLSY